MWGIRLAPAAAWTIAVSVSLTSGVRASEELLMPYECTARGGEVRLAPSEGQSYRIYGAREHQVFSACSPSPPNRCRNWMLFRFDLDCGGTRVPWLRVVDAAARDQGRRVWVDGGRLHLQMGPFWAIERERPDFLRRWRHDGGRWRNGDPRDEIDAMDRPFTGARAADPRQVVELPPGFAPTLGLRAQFIAAPAPDAASLPAMGDAPAAAEAKAPKPKTARNEPPRAAPKQAEPAAKPEKPAPPPKQEKPARELVTGVGTSAAPTIINRPPGSAPAGAEPAELRPGSPRPADDAKPEAPAPAAAASHDKSGAAAEEAPATATVTLAPPDPESGSARPVTTGSLRTTKSPAGPPIGLATPMGRALAALAAMGLAAAAFLAWIRRQERSRLRLAAHRDLASVSWEGGRDHGNGTTARSLVSSPEPAKSALRQVGPTLPPAAGGAGEPSLAAAGDHEFGERDTRLPTTRAEAFRALGASPDAAPDAVKKIVDGLRQSWHPDLAQGEGDRRIREARLKQINVAWDIISGRQSNA